MIGILFRDTRQFLHGWTWIVVVLFYAQTYVVEFTLPANPQVTCAALGPLLTATGVLLLALPCAIQTSPKASSSCGGRAGGPYSRMSTQNAWRLLDGR